MAVTTLVRSWSDYSKFEQMQHHFLKIGVSVVFIIGFTVLFVHLTCVSSRLLVFLLSVFSIWVLASSLT